VAATRARLAGWFSAMRIAAPLDRGRVQGEFPLWKLLLATERDGAKLEDVAPEFAVHLVRRALQGAPLGHALLAAILRRLRLARGGARLASARVGLLRMCLNDLTTRNGSGGTTMPETLDESVRHPAYLCGRLLAVFEGLQYQASQKDVGTTVVDRYYALASTNPAVAFPKIEQLGQHHLKKLRRDKPAAAVAIGRRLAELHEAVAANGARFPGQLSLEDQGRFAIGFHHQKAEDQARIAAAKAEREATAPA
jgi:CRISPR-associated protein Csd1